ncbi:hypothetical protein JYU34_007296 [Plutella xylostella]|uniref:EF-hand domain-containing protein n=1 Tax=Plutella xylostella TaxID=51655 RepID=A0ABQ7QQ33_PLUXY|nr:hypothetical protein JYU34_007296 [Plutella xylostella]
MARLFRGSKDQIDVQSRDVTLTILDINREKLLKCAEDGQAMQILSQYLEGIYNDEAVALSTEPRTVPKTIKIQDLIYKSYTSYASGVSSECIEHLRLKHRLKVVRQLEDSLERNTLKALQQDKMLEPNELQELLLAIREELLWAKRVPCERIEAPYESYRLDYSQFKSLFSVLSPWAEGDYGDAITTRMFKLLDLEDSGYINARSLAQALGLSARAEAPRRLAALYCMHAPPLLPARDLDPPRYTAAGDELAADAISFFDSTEDPSTPDSVAPSLQQSLSESADGTHMDKSTDSASSQLVTAATAVRSLALSPGYSGSAPALPRAHFLQLLAAMHRLAQRSPPLYDAVAHAGTMLLQLGELNGRPDLDREISQDSLYLAAQTAKMAVEDMDLEAQEDPNGNPTVSPRSPATPEPLSPEPAEPNWSITLEQFLATMLAQPLLEEFFNEKVPLLPRLEELRHRDRLHSVS